jgi:anion-transporting  ArsA/GET3 family ATPase
MIGKRFLLVAGKGGVGKSTVAAALSVAAARSGLRALVVETAGCADVPPLLGRPAGDPLTEVELLPKLHHVTIERRGALEGYLRREVPGPIPAAMLARSRAFGLFVEAAPGMSDLLTIGKVWELGQRPRHTPHAHPYDLVILDAPASGQLVGLLAAPGTFSRTARVGPAARQAAGIERALTDKADVGAVVVATAEQMAVAVGLRATLSERFGVEVGAVVVNRVLPARFSPEDGLALAAAPDDPAIRSARWFHARAQAQRTELERLVGQLEDVACITLPLLFEAELGPEDPAFRCRERVDRDVDPRPSDWTSVPRTPADGPVRDNQNPISGQRNCRGTAPAGQIASCMTPCRQRPERGHVSVFGKPSTPTATQVAADVAHPPVGLAQQSTSGAMRNFSLPTATQIRQAPGLLHQVRGRERMLRPRRKATIVRSSLAPARVGSRRKDVAMASMRYEKSGSSPTIRSSSTCWGTCS